MATLTFPALPADLESAQGYQICAGRHHAGEVSHQPSLKGCITECLLILALSPPRFFKMLESDPLRAWYGEAHVLKAAERGAIGKLLISDEIFRSPSVVRRKQFVALVENVKAYGGEVLIFSSMHESGQREWCCFRYCDVHVFSEPKTDSTSCFCVRAELNTMTGLAAILTYPLDIEDVEREEAEEAEERARAAAEAEQ